MVAEVFSAMIQGIEGQIVKIQVDISNGLPNFNMIGYLSNEVKESKERVRTALNNIGVLLPPKRISVNFAPADFRKCGTSFDIGVAAAILLAMDFVPETYIKDTLFVGELSLNGQICPISGVLPIVVAASKRGIKRCIVAQENVAEAAFVEQMEVVGCRNLEELFFYACVRGRISIFVSGGTGTGKTTLLNMLSAYVPSNELIITIEDTCELKLQQPNVRRMEVRSSTSSDMLTVDQKILVRNALRQRPDRIILGETRDGSIVDLISAMSSGHDGSISTIHANDPENMCNVRIPILYSMNKDVNFSEKSIAMQISEAIQVIVQIKRFPDGSRKISQISCVEGLDENDKVKVVDIFRYDKNKKGFIATGYVPRSIIEKIRSQNIPFQESIFEVKRGEENA